jgi:putative transposase
MEIDFSLPSERVIRALKQIIEWRGRPLVIRCDNGPENISGVMQNWAEEAGIALQYIQARKASAKCVHQEIQSDCSIRMALADLLD